MYSFVATPTPRRKVRTKDNKVVQQYIGRRVGFIEKDLEIVQEEQEAEEQQEVSKDSKNYVRLAASKKYSLFDRFNYDE